MLVSYSEYRILVSQLLLGFYILGAFQAPVLELLHLISHSIVHHEHTGMHSYAHHGNSDTHTILQVLETGEEHDNDEEHTFVKPVDKNEYLSESDFSLNIISKSSSIQKEIIQSASSIKLDIPLPPPECFI